MKTVDEFLIEYRVLDPEPCSNPEIHPDSFRLMTTRDCMIGTLNNIRKVVFEYARYYHEEKLKELTDEVINLDGYIGDMSEYDNGYARGFDDGKQDAREWYLKNTK